MNINFENLINIVKNIINKYKLYFIFSLIIIFIIIFYLITPKKERIIYDFNITTASNKMDVILSNSDFKYDIEVNDIINVIIGKNTFKVPIVDNSLFFSIDENYAMINNNNIILKSKYTNFNDKIDSNIKEAKIELIKKNGYKYGDYLNKNGLNKINYRDYSSDYEYVNFLHLNNTNLYSANIDFNNDTKIDIFEKIINESNIKDIIIYNMEYNDFIYYIRTNDPNKHLVLQNTFNDNRILTIEPIDYNKIDNFYKRLNQIIKMIYNNDGPYVFVNTIKNDEIVIYNIIFDALQNKNYDEMLLNFISFYKTYYNFNEDDKLLKNNYDEILRKIFNIDNNINLKNLNYKSLLIDYIDDVDDLTLNYIINKLTLSDNIVR